jgi:hypothetical protein
MCDPQGAGVEQQSAVRNAATQYNIPRDSELFRQRRLRANICQDAIK